MPRAAVRSVLGLVLVIALPAVALPAAAAQLRLALPWGDGAVIQRGVPVPVRGWADAGAEVTVTFAGETTTTRADMDGAWRVELPAREAGGPFDLSVGAGEARLDARDVLVGDVWLCSGQSNMEWPVASSMDAETEVAAANDPRIRHFKVPRSSSFETSAELAGGEWQAADPEVVGDFTAVGYFFARELRRHVDVPVGLVNSSWGGSRIEPWMSAEVLGYESPEKAAEEVRRQVEDDERKRRESLEAKLGELPAEDRGWPGDEPLWADPGLDDTSWETMELPSTWEARGLDGLDGVVWFRTRFELTAAEARAGVRLGLGKVDDSDVSWVNGVEVGHTERAWDRPRAYAVPPSALKEGTNVLVVRVEDFIGGGGIHGDPELLYVEAGSERRSLAGDWKYAVGALRYDPHWNDNQVPTLLYNKMIHPLLGFPIRGVLWYQGESNAGPDDAWEYRHLFRELIDDWRKRFGLGEVPFLFVQLASFMAADDEPAASDWAVLRESQAEALALPGTAQVVTLDVGDADDVHPRNKQEVGRRLALAARRLVYGEDVVFSGPTFRRPEVRGREVVVHFDHVGGGLRTTDTSGAVRGFAVAGEDGRFVWAEGRIEGDGTVVVWSDEVERPAAVRYGWGDNPETANLFNAEGLPAAPFRAELR